MAGEEVVSVFSLYKTGTPTLWNILQTWRTFGSTLVRYSRGVVMKSGWRIRGLGDFKRLRRILLMMLSGRLRIVDLEGRNGTIFAGAG